MKIGKDRFISIPFYTAMEMVQKGCNVYQKVENEYILLNIHDDFTVKGVKNFDALINSTFYYHK